MLDDDDLNQIRSVPADIELQQQAPPKISVSKSKSTAASPAQRTIALPPPPLVTTIQRCRACRSCDRRASTTPSSVPSLLQMARSVSKESVRSASAQGGGGFLSPGCGAPKQVVLVSQQQHQQQQQLQQSHLATIPPVLITTSSSGNGSRIIRQSSQPEASSSVCCGGHTCTHPHAMRQLREAQSEGIAGIAADTLRISGAMRPFKQVSQVVILRG